MKIDGLGKMKYAKSTNISSGVFNNKKYLIWRILKEFK